VSHGPRNPLRVVESRRLTLVAATAELVTADLAGRDEFGTAIGAEVPDEWPPDLYDSLSMRYALQQLRDPSEHGWSLWYLLSKKHDSPRVIGICGFKGKPDRAGSVEIGYSVLRQYRIQGYATEAVARLVQWAFMLAPAHPLANAELAGNAPGVDLKAEGPLVDRRGSGTVGADGLQRHPGRRGDPRVDHDRGQGCGGEGPGGQREA